VTGQGILLSSGISDAMHTRGPYDVANLADVLQLNRPIGGGWFIPKLPSLTMNAANDQRRDCIRMAVAESDYPPKRRREL
jgi:hypothetical protein